MKKFVLSLAVMLSGVLLLCATVIAEGVRVAGSNASGRYGLTGLFEQRTSGVSVVFLVISLAVIAVGAVLSVKNTKD